MKKINNTVIDFLLEMTGKVEILQKYKAYQYV